MKICKLHGHLFTVVLVSADELNSSIRLSVNQQSSLAYQQMNHLVLPRRFVARRLLICAWRGKSPLLVKGTCFFFSYLLLYFSVVVVAVVVSLYDANGMLVI